MVPLALISSGLTYIFHLASLLFSSFIYHLYLYLSFLSLLILLWACDSVEVFGLIGSGLYSHCPCLLILGGVLVGKSPTLFQFRVSLSGSSLQGYTPLGNTHTKKKKLKCFLNWFGSCHSWSTEILFGDALPSEFNSYSEWYWIGLVIERRYSKF